MDDRKDTSMEVRSITVTIKAEAATKVWHMETSMEMVMVIHMVTNTTLDMPTTPRATHGDISREDKKVVREPLEMRIV